MVQIDMTITLGDILTLISLCVFITAVVLTYIQLLHSRKASYSTTSKMTFDILGADDVREARALVYEKLKTLNFEEWDKPDLESAKIVCNSFDKIGIFVKYGMLPKNFVVDHWNGALRESWKILEPLVKDHRKKLNKKYWDDFELMAKQANCYFEKYLSNE